MQSIFFFLMKIWQPKQRAVDRETIGVWKYSIVTNIRQHLKVQQTESFFRVTDLEQ